MQLHPHWGRGHRGSVTLALVAGAETGPAWASGKLSMPSASHCHAGALQTPGTRVVVGGGKLQGKRMDTGPWGQVLGKQVGQVGGVGLSPEKYQSLATPCSSVGADSTPRARAQWDPAEGMGMSQAPNKIVPSSPAGASSLLQAAQKGPPHFCHGQVGTWHLPLRQ